MLLLIRRGQVSEENVSTEQPFRFKETVDALTQRLIDATEVVDFDGASHIRAIWLLCAGQPELIDTSKAAILLSHLRHPPSNVSPLYQYNPSSRSFSCPLQNPEMREANKRTGGRTERERHSVEDLSTLHTHHAAHRIDFRQRFNGRFDADDQPADWWISSNQRDNWVFLRCD